MKRLDIDDAEPGSVHASHASFLRDRYRHDEALAMIAAVRRLHAEDPDVFGVIGEALAEHLQQAVRWFTAGLITRVGHLADLHIDDLRDNSGLRLLASRRLASDVSTRAGE